MFKNFIKTALVVFLLGLFGCSTNKSDPISQKTFEPNAQKRALDAATHGGGIFGDIGKHARSAVGMAALPLNSPVEIELIVEVK